MSDSPSHYKSAYSGKSRVIATVSIPKFVTFRLIIITMYNVETSLLVSDVTNHVNCAKISDSETAT